MEFWLPLLLLAALALFPLGILKLSFLKNNYTVANSISTIGWLCITITSLSLAFETMYFEELWTTGAFVLLSFGSGYFMLASIGYWVPNIRRIGVVRMLKRALRLEFSDWLVLFKSKADKPAYSNPYNIIIQFAMLDGEFNEEEMKYIQNFYLDHSNKNFDRDYKEVQKIALEERFRKLYSSIENYLGSKPTLQEVIELHDSIHTVIHCDKVVTKEEETAYNDINSSLRNYIGAGLENQTYHLYFVPQTPVHIDLCSEQIDNLEAKKIINSDFFLINVFYNERNAIELAASFREKGIPVFILRGSEKEKIHA